MIAFITGILPACGQTGSQSARPGSLRGRVFDQLGGLIVGARITVSDGGEYEKTTLTDAGGNFVILDLPPGKYTMRAEAEGFAASVTASVVINSGRTKQLNIRLRVTLKDQEIRVEEDALLDLGPQNNASALVLRGADIDSLPDSPGGLEAVLRLLALRSSSPFGPQILINGFSGGRLPSKRSIREIRINQNPFSAEYEQMGLSRIEILTKPGTDAFHGEAFLNFNDEVFNSRNPFAPARAPFQSRLYGGNVSGPVVPKRASFFVDFERQEMDDNAVVNATVLDAALRIVPHNLVLLRPERRTTVSPRFDFRLNRKNTLVARYAETRANSRNGGVGDFSLESRAFTSSTTDRSLQLTETAVLSPRLGNETRFQFIRESRSLRGDNSIPAVSVPEAFLGGGSEIGLSANEVDRWELHNHTVWRPGSHSFKAGVQLRSARVEDLSSVNFGGTFTFAGRLAPQLNASNQVVRRADGLPVIVPITTIESYRRTELFRRQGLAPSAIRSLGGGATQFTIAGGNPEARVSQFDLGAFVQDDWRVLANLTMSLGLRLETQTNLQNDLDLAPRAAVAWSPDAGRQNPKTVIRAGFGIFYERFRENYSLQAIRFDGVNQRQFTVSSPAILDLYPNAPSVSSLAAFASPVSIVRVGEDLRPPRTTHYSASIERELPSNFTLAATYVRARTRDFLRSRNVNAPRPETVVPDVPGSGLRPVRNAGEILEYESTGRVDQNQMLVNLVNRFGDRMTLWTTYTWTRARSDTDGPDTFPANSYDLDTEYGRSGLDIRHSIYWGGWIGSFWGIDWNPLVVYRSGVPFNITTGRDTNGDSLYTERPAFATDQNRESVVRTRFGVFDLNPVAGRQPIPRNLAEGPGFFIVNLRISKVLRWSTEPASSAAATPSPAGARGRGRQYGLVLSLQVQNLFNHTNLGSPVGNLSSPLFGNSYSSAGDFGFGSNPAGNRRIEAQLSLHF